MTDTATLTARLAEAEDALHRLRTGAAVVEIRTETETVKYAATNEGSLMRYIGELKAALAGRKRRALGVAF